MKNLFRKNQLMITALAIMIAIAGYLQFAGTDLEKEYLQNDEITVDAVGSTGVITENLTSGQIYTEDALTEIESLDAEADLIVEDYLDVGMTDLVSETADEVIPDAGEIPGEAVFASGSGVEILAEAKLLKEQTRAKNKETLLDIINSTGLTDVQKQEAVDTMVKMTQIAEKEAAAQILLEAKGYTDVVVSIHDNAADVVVNAAELDEVMRAQIEDIVNRKTDIPIQNIIISTVTQ